jgi:hypothetical protein
MSCSAVCWWLVSYSHVALLQCGKGDMRPCHAGILAKSKQQLLQVAGLLFTVKSVLANPGLRDDDGTFPLSDLIHGEDVEEANTIIEILTQQRFAVCENLRKACEVIYPEMFAGMEEDMQRYLDGKHLPTDKENSCKEELGAGSGRSRQRIAGSSLKLVSSSATHED